MTSEQREALGLAEAPPAPVVVPSRLRQAVAGRVGGLPRAFWVLWTGTLVNRVGAFVYPFLALYLTGRQGFSVGAAGAVLTVFGAGGLLAQPLGGALADRLGRRRTLAVAMWAGAASMLLLGAARGTALIVLAAFLVGVTAELYRPASQALVADVIPPAERPRAYGLLFWAVNLGWAVATTLGGVLAEHGFTLLFLGDAATSAVFGLLVWRLVREPARHARPAAERQGGFATVVGDRTFVAFCALQFLYACVLFQFFIGVPLSMRADGLSHAAFGLAVAVNGLVIVLVQPLVLRWLARQPRSATLAVSQLLFGVGFGSLAFASTLPGYAALLAVATLGEIGVSAVASALVADLAPGHLRGRYYGVYGLSFALAGVVAPAGATAIFAGWGADALWLACLLVGAVLCLGQLALTPRVRLRAPAA